MLLLRNIFIILIFIASFVGPYKAFFNSEHSESFIEIMPGDSMYGVISKLAPDSLLNKLFFKFYANKNNINSFQAEDGIRDLVRSRGLGDVYKRQAWKIC